MKYIMVVLFAFVPVLLFGNSEHQVVQTDIIPRTVNFILFAGIVYYLVADKLRDFLTNRTKSIKNKLDEVQQVLDKSKLEVQEAKEKVEKSKILASEIVQGATNEVSTIASKIENKTILEIKHIEVSLENKIEMELKKAKSKVVNELLEELLDDKNIDFDQNKLTQIVLKKVA